MSYLRHLKFDGFLIVCQVWRPDLSKGVWRQGRQWLRRDCRPRSTICWGRRLDGADWAGTAVRCWRWCFFLGAAASGGGNGNTTAYGSGAEQIFDGLAVMRLLGRVLGRFGVPLRKNRRDHHR